MIDFLYSIDLQIFNFLNQTLSCSVLDIVMSTITKVKYWIPLYVIGLACLIVKGGTKGRILVLLLLLGIGISDTLNSRIFKNIVQRERPCHTVLYANLPIGCPGGKSFPSSHAFNNFCAAMIIGMFYKRRRLLFLLIAGIIAITRPYLGVHYPSDIIAGAVLGALLGYLLAIATQKIVYRFWKIDLFIQKTPL